jgi:hypothetical protein
MNTDTPENINESVLSFCHEIVPDAEPEFVKVIPEPYSVLNDCFNNVNNKIKSDGGSIQYGWQIWLWAGTFIEAEFHALWVSNDNQYIDITPKDIPTERIVFVPDASKKYQGIDVDNIRKPLRKDKIIDYFIMLSKANFKLISSGRVGGSMEVSVPQQEYEALTELRGMTLHMLSEGLSRNSMCLCQSGNKFKRCHEKMMDDAANYYEIAL